MSPKSRLSDHERALFARQMRLPGVGEAGQLRLRDAKVLILGAGGLGSPVGLYLAAAGISQLGIADPDKVEISNLHRQIIHGFDTLGMPKTVSAAEALGEINPGARIALHPEGFKPDNAAELISRYDLVVDCTDNFATRYLAADACVLGRRPLVHGSVLRQEGQVASFLPGCGCYRCVYPVMPDARSVPTCADAGVFGATCGVIGSWMAAEVIAVLLGQRTQSRPAIQHAEHRGHGSEYGRDLSTRFDNRPPYRDHDEDGSGGTPTRDSGSEDAGSGTGGGRVGSVGPTRGGGGRRWRPAAGWCS